MFHTIWKDSEMRALRISRGLGISAAALALAIAAPASATTAAPAVQASVAPAAKVDHPCGNHSHSHLGTTWRYWKNCISTSEKIKIDNILWWDKEICVGAGSETELGRGQDTRGASRVGDC
ncbi:hypothetical protein [Streptomyces sp. NBC_01508]|uniref:hypothetical protein n=1 Tax=Streptomyces sp. NBC_01508 TaxID=2903888 RepID=UPI00386C9C76